MGDDGATGNEMTRLLADAERLAHFGAWELDLRTGRGMWSDETYRIHGLEPGEEEATIELVMELVHPEDAERIRRLLEVVVQSPAAVPAEGVTAEYRLLLRDGSLRELRFHGRVDRENDIPARWIGSLQDITEQRVVERELHAHYALAQALHDWQSFDENVVDLLRRLGSALDFPMGALWTCHADEGRLRTRAVWRVPGRAGEDFEVVAREASFAPGTGVIGRAWETEQPIIVPDLSEALSSGRSAAALRSGLRSGLAFPALGDDGPLAVLSFYSADRRCHSDRLARTLAGIGRDLGRFLEGRRAELEPQRLSGRELEVLQLAAEGHSGPKIADRLGLSPATVKTHFENLYGKLGVSDRAAAVADALRTGLIR
jgi:DNA-binding NarL/FixJ family response regulator